MRINLPCAEGLQADAREKSFACITPPLHVKILLIGIDRAGGILHDHPLALHVAQTGGRTRIAIAGLVVAWLLLVQDQADDVVRAPLVQSLLQGGIDHIVGRSHHVA